LTSYLLFKNKKVTFVLKYTIMAQTAGIYIEHNAKGTPIFARIDLKQYGSELRDYFFGKRCVRPYDKKQRV
jgi:hypothetical protein